MRKILAGILALALLLCSVAGFAESETEYQELATGSKGEEVRLLQERLKELGYYTISVDGDYGKGTLGAVSGFQGRNGLEATGIADAETQKLLYSEDALSAPAAPNVEVIKVEKNREDVFFTVRNNMDADIDQFTYVMCTYNQEGKIEGHSHGIMTYFTEDVFPYFYTENVTIKAHGSKRIGYDYTDRYMAIFQTVGVAVSSYHIISGETYQYDTQQLTFKKSDGTMMYPIKDSTEPNTISSEEEKRADSVRFGLDNWEIPYYAADFYSAPAGCYIVDVTEGSIADLAGLRRGDVITAFDDTAYSDFFSAGYAKLKMLDGQDVVVSYWRNGKTYTTIFSLDEEKMNSTQNGGAKNNANFSVADELIKLADLLDKGILTQEEFDAQKAKLLAE